MERASKLSFALTVAKMLALGASIFFVIGPGAASAQSDSATRSAELKAGIKLVEQRRDFEAVDLLKRVTNKNKTDSEAWFYLGLAYVGLLNIKD